jgi:hypothetical protein
MWTIIDSSADKNAHLPELDEPLVLAADAAQKHHAQRATTRWKKFLATTAWLLGILVLSGTLLIQWFYFNQEQAVSSPGLRTYWQMICERSGCDVPPAQDASALRSVLLDVSDHPTQPQVLQVRFRIQNTSAVPQKFPAVELSFRNTQNEVVAARRFYPGHYLNPQAFLMLHLRPSAEVDGLLEIQNPGEDAVNYAIQFVYEQTQH